MYRLEQENTKSIYKKPYNQAWIIQKCLRFPTIDSYRLCLPECLRIQEIPRHNTRIANLGRTTRSQRKILRQWNAKGNKFYYDVTRSTK